VKKLLAIVLAIAMVASIAGAAFAQQDQTGNGAPSGYHYTLNIIGVDNPKTQPMDDSSGHVIFVSLSGHNKIELCNGTDFAVLDANAFDDPAVFMLPPPGIDPYVIGGNMTGVDTETDYSVFVRPLGKPGGWTTITTCAEVLDSTFGGLLPNNVQRTILNSPGYFGGNASIEQVGQQITERKSGKSTFTNVTAQLTTIVFRVWVDLNSNSEQDEGEIYYVRVPIFDASLQGEYWDYNNAGLKLLQVRFYPGFVSDVTDWDVW
jgi:hypothetical protein